MQSNSNEVKAVKKAAAKAKEEKLTVGQSRKGVTLLASGKFLAQFRPADRSKRESKTFDTEKAAREWMEDMRVGLRNAPVIKVTSLAKTKMTLGDRMDGDGNVIEKGLLSQYSDLLAADGRLTRSAEDVYRRMAKHPVLVNVSVLDVDYKLAKAFALARRKGVNHLGTLRPVAPSTIKQEFKHAAAAMRKMARAQEWGKFDPWDISFSRELTGDGYMSNSHRRTTRPSDEQLKQLMEAAKAWEGKAGKHGTIFPLRDMIHVAARNAFRREELTELRWADLDVEKRVITLWNTKDSTQRARKLDKNGDVVKIDTHTYRAIIADPVLGDVMDVLLRQPHDGINVGKATPGITRDDPRSRIFPYNPASFGQAFVKLIRRLDMKGNEGYIRLHDLRHEAISQLPKIFKSTTHMMMVSGHKSEANLRRYVNNTVDDVAIAAKIAKEAALANA